MQGEIEMYTHEGVCKYCGDIQPVMAADQIDADCKISEACPCGGHKKAKQWKKILNSIELLLGERARENGFTQAHIEQIELVQKIAHEVVKGRIDSARISLENTAVTINTNNKGAVKISRQRVNQTTFEA